MNLFQHFIQSPTKMSIFSILRRSFRRIQYHELERMFGRLFLSPFSFRGFCNNSRYYNSYIHRRISRLQFIYNFVNCFSRVKSIPWCGSWFLVRRFTHIMNNANLFCMSIQFFQSLAVVKEQFLQTNFSSSISVDFQTNNESVRVQFIYFHIFIYPLSLIIIEISRYIRILLLLRSGDVEPNPGPENTTFNFHKKQLSFCHLNVRSLLQQSDIGKRFDHLYNYICRDNCYDVVALTETHLSRNIDDNEINIENYTLFRIDRNRHGGGIAIYCRSELQPMLLTSLNVQGIEIFWIQVSIQKNKNLFGTCYRPPNQNADERKIFFLFIFIYFKTLHHFIYITEMKNKNIA